jgi:ATP-dependent protease ClpP protease subunit
MESEEEGLNIKCLNNELYFYEDITPKSVLCLNTFLRTMERNVHGPIILYINSVGGDLFSGLSAMDHIMSTKVPVHTVADGLCCSAATFMFLAGQKRLIKQHSHLLIHQISQESEWVRFEDMKDELKNLEKLMANVIQIYRDYTELPEPKLKRMMKRDMYLDADECIKYKIADEIFPSCQNVSRSKREAPQ